MFLLSTPEYKGGGGIIRGIGITVEVYWGWLGINGGGGIKYHSHHQIDLHRSYQGVQHSRYYFRQTQIQ